MASATLSNVLDVFPVGTTVGAYKRASFPMYAPPETGTTPVPSADTTAVVGATGSLAFTGLAGETSYVAGASVSGTWKFRGFTTQTASRNPLTTEVVLRDRMPLNVKDEAYGAVGDGVTNDTAAVQAAIDVASTAGGGVVFFPPGTYLVTNLTPKSKVSYDGLGATILATTGNTNPVFYRPSTTAGTFENVSWRNLIFQGEVLPGAAASHNAIYVHGAVGATIRNIRVEDCTFNDFANAAIYINNGQRVYIRHNTLSNCVQYTAAQNAINVVVPSGSTSSAVFGEIIIEGNVIDTTLGAGIAIPILVAAFSGRAVITGNVVKNASNWAGIALESNASHHHVTVSGNTLLDCQTGIDCSNTGGTAPDYADYRGFVLSNNVIDSSVAAAIGIKVQTSNTVVSGNSIRGEGRAVWFGGNAVGHRAVNQLIDGNQCVCSAAAAANHMLFGSSGDNVTVRGNRVSAESGAAYHSGLVFSDGAALHVTDNHFNTPGREGIDLTDAQDGVVANNVIFDCSTNTSNTYSGIVHAGNVNNGLAIRDNVIVDRRGGSAKMKWGVSVTAGGSTGTPVRLIGNTILGFVTASVNGRALVTVDQGNIVDTKGSAYWDAFNGTVGAPAPSSTGWVHGTSAAVLQLATGARFMPRRDILVTNLRYVVTVAAANNLSVDVGIYDSIGTTKLASSGQTVGKLNALGGQSVNLSASYQLKAGTVYYIAFVATDPSALGGGLPSLAWTQYNHAQAPRVFGATMATGLDAGQVATGVSTGLPASLGGLSAATTFPAISMWVCEA